MGRFRLIRFAQPSQLPFPMERLLSVLPSGARQTLRAVGNGPPSSFNLRIGRHTPSICSPIWCNFGPGRPTSSLDLPGEWRALVSDYRKRVATSCCWVKSCSLLLRISRLQVLLPRLQRLWRSPRQESRHHRRHLLLMAAGRQKPWRSARYRLRYSPSGWASRRMRRRCARRHAAYSRAR
jgi:hypothetical protein